MDRVYIYKEMIYDILLGCGLFETYNQEYGEVSVISEDEVMDEFLPQVVTYINDIIGENKIILE